MKILFLDDNEERHLLFKKTHIGHDITYVYTYETALEALKTDIFKEIWLDHDLSAEMQTAYVAGLSPPEEKTGYDVAKYIVEELDPDKLPNRIIIHSMNIPAAKRMQNILKELRIPIKLWPFGSISFK